MVKTESKEKSVLKEKLIQPFALVVHNDDYNSFDHVINCLISICEHTYQQASQCTNIIHYVGKCDVKRGSYEYMDEIKQKLISKNLSCTIVSV